jgi:hypothetical protein
MSTRALAVVLTLVMIAAAFVALTPASGAAHSLGGSAPAASPQVAGGATPDVGITFDLLNGYGEYAADTYYIGEIGWDTLNFEVHDALDSAVNLTITDPNATRDGVSSPAFSYHAVLNTTTHGFYSPMANVHYTFPDLPYGGTWVVNFSAPNAGYVTQNVSLQAYYLEVSTSVSYPASTLPGEPISVTWWAYYESNGGLYSGATSVFIAGWYDANGTTENLFSGGMLQIPTGSWGQWNGTVPLNTSADSDLEFEVWAITTVGGVVAENESATTEIQVGALVLYEDGLTYFPVYCLDDFDDLLPNDATAAACVQVGSEYEDEEFTPIAGLPVTIAYWNGTAHVPPNGAAPTSATTNSAGVVTVTFNASSPPFLTEFQYPFYANAVNFTVTVPGATASNEPWTIWDNITGWAISPFPLQSGVVNVVLDHTEYFSGATATATWSIASSASATTGPITPDSWYVWNWDDYNTIYATGTLGGTAQSGTFTFPITPAMVGQEIEVDVYAVNATEGFDSYTTAEVIAPTLLLTTDNGYYTSGSSVTTTASLAGDAAAPAGTSITWQAWGYWNEDTNDVLLASGSVANGGSFSFPIASSTPPVYVEIDAWASAGGQQIATTDTYLSLEIGYQVLLGVGTVSSYSDGSFQPGQTVSLTYQVIGIDGTPLPQVFDFYLYALGSPFQQEIQNVGPSGSVSFTIPSNAPAGTVIVELQVSGTLSGGECLPEFDDENCIGTTTLTVNPHPSVLSMELGAGSGLTVGWLILLVIVILVAIVLFVVLRRRGGSRMSGGSNTATPMGPPAPAPSTPPATEWQQPGSSPPPSGDAQPPLPPPSGSS